MINEIHHCPANFRTTVGLFDRYGPERLRDTPICERGFVGLACGAAMTGSRPVVDFMFLDFILDALGELINQVAKMQYMSSGRLRMPILLRGCVGIGHSAATHHSGNYYPMYAHFPGLRVVVPSTPFDAKGLLARALTGDDPVLYFEHRELLAVKGPVPQGDYEIEFGQAAVARAGRDVTVVGLSWMNVEARLAADILQKRGVSVEIIDPRTLAPLDEDLIVASVERTGRCIIADCDWVNSGFSAELSARINEKCFGRLKAPVRRIGFAHTPCPTVRELENEFYPNAKTIVHAIEDMLGLEAANLDGEDFFSHERRFRGPF